MKQPAVYIMTNQRNGTLYVGVTSDLTNKVKQHKENIIDGFTKKYNCKTLVFYEAHDTMEAVITREKQIKAGSRQKKLKLIEDMNVLWEDLYKELI